MLNKIFHTTVLLNYNHYNLIVCYCVTHNKAKHLPLFLSVTPDVSYYFNPIKTLQIKYLFSEVIISLILFIEEIGIYIQINVHYML